MWLWYGVGGGGCTPWQCIHPNAISDKQGIKALRTKEPQKNLKPQLQKQDKQTKTSAFDSQSPREMAVGVEKWERGAGSGLQRSP